MEERRSARFPEPSFRFQGEPVWAWEEMEDWARQTGRLPARWEEPA